MRFASPTFLCEFLQWIFNLILDASKGEVVFKDNLVYFSNTSCWLLKFCVVVFLIWWLTYKVRILSQINILTAQRFPVFVFASCNVNSPKSVIVLPLRGSNLVKLNTWHFWIPASWAVIGFCVLRCIYWQVPVILNLSSGPLLKHTKLSLIELTDVLWLLFIALLLGQLNWNLEVAFILYDKDSAEKWPEFSVVYPSALCCWQATCWLSLSSP